MQPVWLCILSGRPSEDTSENTQWRKVKQMQPVWLRMFAGRKLEETFENPQCWKMEQMKPVGLFIYLWTSALNYFFLYQKCTLEPCQFLAAQDSSVTHSSNLYQVPQNSKNKKIRQTDLFFSTYVNGRSFFHNICFDNHCTMARL